MKRKLKPTHRFYTYERSIKLRSGEKEIVLKRHSPFRLETFNDRPAVVKDGVVFFIKPELVKELIKRSVVANVEKHYADRLEFLNQNGLKIQRVLVKNLDSLVHELEGTNVRHDFTDGVIRYMFDTVYDQRPSMIQVLFTMSQFSIGAAIYYSSKDAIDGWSAVPVIERKLEKFVKYLTTTFDEISVNNIKMKKVTAKLGGVTLFGKAFSGFSTYFATSWKV